MPIAAVKKEAIVRICSAGAWVPDITFIQNQDNREISILNSDDYNAYHGGMIAAVRSIKGEAPRSYCGDSSDRKSAHAQRPGEEIAPHVPGAKRINPKFIEGMKKAWLYKALLI